jgi:hypothetical protein
MPALTKRTVPLNKATWLPRLRMNLIGEDATFQAIDELTVRMQKDIIRQATRSAMGPISAAAKKNIKQATKNSEQSTKHLYEHIQIKVQQNKKKPWLIYGLVGARRDKPQVYKITRTWKDRKTGKMHSRVSIVKRKASNYLHLLENGFIHYRTGKIVPGRKVLQRAMSAQRNVALERFKATLRRLIPKHVAAARARARSRSKKRQLAA